MKGKVRRLKVAEDVAPVDSIEVVCREDLEKSDRRIERKIKAIIAVGTVVAVALFAMIVRKDE
jgi:hypothetical protein